MKELRHNTAAVTIRMGPFNDATDGVTPETGLTIVQADVRLSKNGAVAAQKTDTSGGTHDEFGYYRTSINVTDNGTLGRLRVTVNVAGAIPVWEDFMVVSQQYYDAKYGTALQQVDLRQIGGNSVAGNLATLTLKTLDIQSSVGSAVIVKATDGSDVVKLDGTGGGNVLSLLTNGAGQGVRVVAGTRAVYLSADAVMEMVADNGYVLRMQTTDSAAHVVEMVSANGNGVDIDVGGSGIRIDSSGFCLDLDSAGANAVDISSINGHGINVFGTAAGIMVRGTSGLDLDAREIGTPVTLGDGASLANMLLSMAGKTASAASYDRTTDSLEAVRDRGDAAWITAGAGITQQQVRDSLKLAPTGGAPAAGSVDTHLDDLLIGQAAIKADTGATFAKLPSGTISDFDETTDAVDLNADQTGVTIGTVDDLGSAAIAAVNAAVDTALDDLIPEPVAGAPAATCSVRTGMARLYGIARNKGQLNSSSGEKVYYNSSGVAISKKAVSDNGTTYEETAMTGV